MASVAGVAKLRHGIPAGEERYGSSDRWNAMQQITRCIGAGGEVPEDAAGMSSMPSQPHLRTVLVR